MYQEIPSYWEWKNIFSNTPLNTNFKIPKIQPRPLWGLRPWLYLIRWEIKWGFRLMISSCEIQRYENEHPILHLLWKKWTLGRYFCPPFRGKRIIPAFPFFYSPFERRSDTGHRVLLVHSFCVMRREGRPPNFGITWSPFCNEHILKFISALELKSGIFFLYYSSNQKSRLQIEHLLSKLKP